MFKVLRNDFFRGQKRGTGSASAVEVWTERGIEACAELRSYGPMPGLETHEEARNQAAAKYPHNDHLQS